MMSGPEQLGSIKIPNDQARPGFPAGDKQHGSLGVFWDLELPAETSFYSRLERLSLYDGAVVHLVQHRSQAQC